mmetsp:Transcript_37091/g.111097  ORF Transcript_37091/g.111097 Transcript_37091/m.111097 type:complete len:98 (-) Transcript_37091:59-352(-)
MHVVLSLQSGSRVMEQRLPMGADHQCKVGKSFWQLFFGIPKVARTIAAQRLTRSTALYGICSDWLFRRNSMNVYLDKNCAHFSTLQVSEQEDGPREV